MQNLYVRLCRGVKDKGILIKEEDLYNYVDDKKDWYSSLYYYNQEQYEEFQKVGSVKGVKDVITNKLLFDIDFKEDLPRAHEETKNVVAYLLENGFIESEIEIYFSGRKGFHVLSTLDSYFTPKEMKQIIVNIQKDIDLNIDLSVYDYTQLLRVPGTRHQESGLYKFPLSVEHLYKIETMTDITNRAHNLDNAGEFNWQVVRNEHLPAKWLNFPKEEPKKEVKLIDGEIDWTKKPKHWKNCKWALLNGHFKEGERHQALLVIAATCRGLGYDRELTYYTCKAALKKQASITGQEEFSKDELWENIIEESVFKDGWEGGQYSCKSDPWLHKYCEDLGTHKCADRNEEPPTVTFDLMGAKFLDYAENFDQNIIKTGLTEFDNNVTFLASTLVGVLGQPGAGKTSKALNYLKNTSLEGIPSLFFSLDMGLPIVFAKLVQKNTGYSFKKVMDIYRNNPKERDKLNAMIQEEYKNVGFNFKSGLTTADIKMHLANHQEKIGKPVKLVVIDYLECISGPYSDAVANTGLIANQLKDLANETNTCVVLLLQTQKHSTSDVSDPLLSMKNVKGSSVLEQSMSVIVTLWRDGYSPKTVDDDKYISFAVVKNRFGSLWQGDFSWEGVTGNIRSLTDEEKDELQQFRALKKLNKIAEEKEKHRGSGGWE